MAGGTKHIHLDAIGGISGNMFVGAMLACFPELEKGLDEQIIRAGFPDLVTLRSEQKKDGVLEGVLFRVLEDRDQVDREGGGHDHVHYRQIREKIEGGDLDEPVKKHVLGIFHCLANAEAHIHGSDVDEVVFHEVGAWDSIADIVCAGYLIEASGALTWSVSNLPLGRGQVKTAHGPLPLPAPAVTFLLSDFRFQDDGIEGERVTPTGAAILNYLDAAEPGSTGSMILVRSGFGFGSNVFPGISNVLRAMVFDRDDEKVTWQYDEVIALAFEVDDQTPEDLAAALDRIGDMEGVLDVSSQPLLGKKRRMSQGVRILATRGAEQDVLTACFNETSTLGVRLETVKRAVLPRLEVEVEVDGRAYRAKVTERPNGKLAAKAELKDILKGKLSRPERERLRREIETAAIEKLVSQYREDGNGGK